MSVLLKVVGGIWAILSSANIVMTFRNDVLSSIGAFGLLWNFVLFIFPGLVLYGIGAATVASHGPLRRATAAPLQAWDRVYLSSGNGTALQAADFARNRSIFSCAAVIVVEPCCSETLFRRESLGGDESKTHGNALDDAGRMSE